MFVYYQIMHFLGLFITTCSHEHACFEQCPVAHKGHAANYKVAANKIKCCTFKIVAANFQNELRQIERMFLQVKAIAFARWPNFNTVSFLKYLAFLGPVLCTEQLSCSCKTLFCMISAFLILDLN